VAIAGWSAVDRLPPTGGFQEKGCLFFLQADVAATVELPDAGRKQPRLPTCCVGDGALVDDLQAMLCEAGFSKIRITPKDESREFIRDWVPGREDRVVCASNEAVKPV
jgi:arsenite methyltransferase